MTDRGYFNLPLSINSRCKHIGDHLFGAIRTKIALILISAVVFSGCSDSEPVQVFSDQSTSNAEVSSNDLPILDVCVTPWMPFSYRIADRPSGIMVDLVKDVSLALGYQPRFHFMALQRCYAEAQQNRIQLNVYTSPLALSRPNSQLRAIEPSVQNQMPVLVVNSNSPLDQNPGLAHLSGKKIAGLRGNSIMIRQRDVGVEWVFANHLDYLWQLLVSQRVDAVLGDYHSQVMLSPEQRKAVEFLLPPIHIEPIYWSTHQDNTDLAEQISAELIRRLDDGVLDYYYQQHLGVTLTQLKTMIESNHYHNIPSLLDSSNNEATQP